MKIYVKKHNHLKIVATTKPERNLLKNFSKKDPYIVGFAVETMDDQETEVSLTVSFRTLAKPQEPKHLKEKE